MRRALIAPVFAVVATLAVVAPAAAKPGGVNPVGTCSTQYTWYADVYALLDAYPDLATNLGVDVVGPAVALVDHNGNGAVCGKTRPDQSTPFDRNWLQVNMTDDNKKSGQG